MSARLEVPPVSLRPLPWRRIVGVDSEWDPQDRTRLACVTFCEHLPATHGPDEVSEPWIKHGRDPELADYLLSLLRDPEILTVWAWGCADATTLAKALGPRGLEVLKALADASKRGAVSDVCVRDLIAWAAVPDWGDWWQLGTGAKYRIPGSDDTGETRPAVNLSALSLRWLGEVVAKDDAIRMTFGPLADVPIERWPEEYPEHLAYALGDASLPVRVWLRQWRCEPVAGPRENVAPGKTKVGKGRKAQHVDARKLGGHVKRWPSMQVHLYPPGIKFADKGLIPSESERLGVMYALEWARECGGLYVDGEYLERLILCYESAAALCLPHMYAAGVIVDRDPGDIMEAPTAPLDIVDDMIGAADAETCEAHPEADSGEIETRGTMDLERVRNRTFKQCRAGNRAAAFELFSSVCEQVPTWAPELTKKGTKVTPWLSRTPWPRWPDEHRIYASCGGRVVGEAAQRMETDTTALKCLTKPIDVCLEPLQEAGATVLDDAAQIEHTTLGKGLAQSKHPWAVAVSVYNKASKYARDFLSPLREFARTGAPVRPGFQPFLITGRLSLEGAIRQNEPRKGGIRECFLPPAGHMIVLADYSQIELVDLARLLGLAYDQTHGTSGYVSSLARVLNAGKDAHIIFALDLIEEQNPETYKWIRSESKAADEARIAAGFEPNAWDYLARQPRKGAAPVAEPSANIWRDHDLMKALRKRAETLLDEHGKAARTTFADFPWAHVDVILSCRQEAKNCNYGFGGLMQPAKFVLQQRRQGSFSWTLAKAETAYRRWRQRWIEFALYEKLCKQLAQNGFVRHPGCERLRGGLNPTQCANTLFQTECAEMFVWAFFHVWYECLFGHAPEAEAPSAADLATARAVLDGKLPPEAWPATVSRLYGSTPVLAIHDEIVLVTPAPDMHKNEHGQEVSALANGALGRMQAIMVHAGALYLPGMLVETSGAAIARWRKV